MKRYCFADEKYQADDVRTDETWNIGGVHDGLRSYDSIVEALLYQKGPVLFEVKPGLLRTVDFYQEECKSKTLRIISRHPVDDHLIYHLAFRIAADVSTFWDSPKEKISEYLKTGREDLREELLYVARKASLSVNGEGSEVPEDVQRAELALNSIYSMIAALSRGYVDKDRDYTPIPCLKRTVQLAGYAWSLMSHNTREQQKVKYNEWMEELFLTPLKNIDMVMV